MTLASTGPQARDEGRIGIDDVRRSGHCVTGTRTWFERHGLDFRDFLKNGISEADFLASGDAIAAEIVARKRGRRDEGGHRGV